MLESDFRELLLLLFFFLLFASSRKRKQQFERRPIFRSNLYEHSLSTRFHCRNESTP